jgi:hypothetical protein
LSRCVPIIDQVRACGYAPRRDEVDMRPRKTARSALLCNPAPCRLASANFIQLNNYLQPSVHTASRKVPGCALHSKFLVRCNNFTPIACDGNYPRDMDTALRRNVRLSRLYTVCFDQRIYICRIRIPFVAITVELIRTDKQCIRSFRCPMRDRKTLHRVF